MGVKLSPEFEQWCNRAISEQPIQISHYSDRYEAKKKKNKTLKTLKTLYRSENIWSYWQLVQCQNQLKKYIYLRLAGANLNPQLNIGQWWNNTTWKLTIKFSKKGLTHQVDIKQKTYNKSTKWTWQGVCTSPTQIRLIAATNI